MKWYERYNKRVKIASDHGDTIDGQLMEQEFIRLIGEISSLRREASTGGPSDVMPRWKGEIRRQILLLPALEVLTRMSMVELKEVSSKVIIIKNEINKYSLTRVKKIMSKGQ